ncbi:hypothetical protein AX17_003270 [Amanita inopinata Kibby_2008]|nr:hypothetical protein AX17_003270 [Amanita inopinata Kibby_2008]
MATRRPASRAAKATNPQSQRPRSVLAKPAHSVRAADEAPQSSQQEHTAIAQRLNKSSNSQDPESNIQVVIRCRRRSEREIQDNSPIIVTSTGAKSKDLTIEAAPPVSSLGIVQLPPVRKYGFDMVFGPEADQAMIYHDVVHPMLQEVLMGYNCTLFAYGQTGTGKTYTMQGDLTPTPMGNPSPNAGMIPRVLFRMFHELEKSGADYSVKISFVELYNEELRDLLANDLPPPSGNVQPMGANVKDNTKGQDNSLKIFDDANKRGVFIQGLEETAVKDSQDALALLTKGSLRRQIAATKFNDHSSRSHSVFSITVHTKETSSIGDDLLRVGKLNLVDLAGSENIGRSGAENKRAREAGMINQSLLTLGRVINSLVDKAQHVPYRESKLTRLLQDSLGGHTKTCIVATISPARSNMEETLSTLDYALRAKSIRNKPELNQRMSRNALLKEYIAEIERLKADVLATREKNGIYFSEENWKQICNEQELQQTELAEAKKQVEIVEKELRSVREEYDQSIALLRCRESELKETREKLAETGNLLVQKEADLNNVRFALEEEVVVRKAHQETETALNVVATGLQRVAKDSLQDVSSLFAKLERKQDVLSANSHAVVAHGKTISASTDVLMQKLDNFVRSAKEHIVCLHDGAIQFETKGLEALGSRSKKIEEQLEQLSEAFASIQKNDGTEMNALRTVQKALQDVTESLRMDASAWSHQLKELFQKQRQEIELVRAEGFSTLESSLKVMGSLTEGILKDARRFSEAERTTMQRAKTLAESAADTEVQRLRKQNQILVKLLDDEKLKAEKAQHDLLQRISGLLGDYVNARDRNLRQAVGLVQDENKQAADALSTFTAEHEQVMAHAHGNAAEMDTILRERSKECKRTRDGALKVLSEVQRSVDSHFDDVHATTTESVRKHVGQIQQYTQRTSSSCNAAFEEYTRAKRARVDTTTSVGTGMQANYRSFIGELSSASLQTKSVMKSITSEATDLKSLTESYQGGASHELRVSRDATRILDEEGTKNDVPLGSTPRKRRWDYVDRWELTKSRNEVLKAWRQGQSTASSSAEQPISGDVDLEDNTEMAMEHLQPPTPELVESPGSLVSSLSSTTSIPIAAPPPPSLVNKKVLKSALHSASTLTDSKNVYNTRRLGRIR